jgi:hypothetical protein
MSGDSGGAIEDYIYNGHNILKYGDNVFDYTLHNQESFSKAFKEFKIKK